MKLSEAWLREWVNPNLDIEALVKQITMAGLEVDGCHPVAGAFDKVIVAEVLTCKAHPQADKLSLCEINPGTGPTLKVVCGAANVRAGLKVALAMIGAKLPNGMEIKEAKLRGELSQGMLCSSSELGLEDKSEGIMELEKDAPLGMDFREYMALNDQVIDVDLTPNRGDCFSVLGIAREVAALNRLPLKFPTIDPVIPAIDATLSVKLEAKEACPKYCGRVIRGINTDAKTPLWMKERLRRAGIRSLHPVVDVTNYVMIELGQPMHAFDMRAVKEGIVVRLSQENESIELLDGQTLKLDNKVLLIADAEKALGLAGIMGGANSAVVADSQDIFLEAAFFNPQSIAGNARRFGLCSDSSQRFERGVDPSIQSMALERATKLLLDIVGGQAGPVTTLCNEEYLPQKTSICFNPAHVARLTGVEVDKNTMEQILEGLGLKLTRQGESWLLQVPSHRFDLHQEVDLIEEIIRVYGYDNIKSASIISTMTPGNINPLEQLSKKVAEFLQSRAYHESISYSFVDPQLQEAIFPGQVSLSLLNPISQELSQMRLSLWPGLIAAMVYNANRQQDAIRFFEIGVVFDMQQGKLLERACLAGLMSGETGGLNWSEESRSFDFFDAKGDLEALFSSLALEVEFTSASHDALHPGQTARIVYQNQAIGWIGVLHPKFQDELDLNHEIILFELDLEPLIQNTPVRYRPISKYPQIRRDLSFIVNKEITAAAIEKTVRSLCNDGWLKAFEVFDLYTGTGVPEGMKSLAIAITLQDEKRTLVDEEINSLICAIISKLEAEFDIRLRD